MTEEKTEEVTDIVLSARANDLEVVDVATQKSSEALRKTCRDAIKVENEPVQEQIDGLNVKHKKLVAIRKANEDKYQVIIDSLTGKEKVFVDAENEKIAEAARKQAQEARDKAVKERKAEAAALRAQGQKGHAKAVQQAPIAPVPVAVAPKAALRVKGARTTWGYRITDFNEFVKGCWHKKGGLHMGCLTYDPRVMKGLATGLKASGNDDGMLPGVLITKE